MVDEHLVGAQIVRVGFLDVDKMCVPNRFAERGANDASAHLQHPAHKTVLIEMVQHLQRLVIAFVQSGIIRIGLGGVLMEKTRSFPQY